MQRIVITGSSGAGKTTLARELHCMLKIKVYHLDRLFWTRGWQKKSEETRRDILQGIVLERQWIIEGTYIDFFGLWLDEADTIIFLDLSLFVCLYRVFKRHYKERGRSRRDIPLECTDKSDWGCIWRVLTFPFRYRQRLVQKLQQVGSKRVIRLRSRKEVDAFLAQLRRTGHIQSFPEAVPVSGI